MIALHNLKKGTRLDMPETEWCHCDKCRRVRFDALRAKLRGDIILQTRKSLKP